MAEGLVRTAGPGECDPGAQPLVGFRFRTEHGMATVTGVAEWSPQYVLVVLDDGSKTARHRDLVEAVRNPTKETQMMTAPKKPAAKKPAAKKPVQRKPSGKKSTASMASMVGPDADIPGPSRGDQARVGDRVGRVTGFARNGDIYVRFPEGKPISGRFPRAEVEL